MVILDGPEAADPVRSKASPNTAQTNVRALAGSKTSKRDLTITASHAVLAERGSGPCSSGPARSGVLDAVEPQFRNVFFDGEHWESYLVTKNARGSSSRAHPGSWSQEAAAYGQWYAIKTGCAREPSIPSIPSTRYALAGADGADGGPVPREFVASTSHVYVLPVSSPVTRINVEVPEFEPGAPLLLDVHCAT